jgi:uncharacterized protein YaaN involved in tellurite resistance
MAKAPVGAPTIYDTLSQRIDALQQGLNQRVDVLQEEVKTASTKSEIAAKDFAGLEKAVALLEQALGTMEHLKQQPVAIADLKGEFQNAINLLKRDIEDLTNWQEEVKQRDREFRSKAWMLVPPILAAILSSTLTGLIGYYFLKQR